MTSRKGVAGSAGAVTALGPAPGFEQAVVDQLYEGIARFGGEEFALTIVEIEEVGLRAIAERQCALVARSRIRTDDHDLQVTISIGGTVAVAGDTSETVFARADAALYRAKDGAGNRVELVNADRPPEGRMNGGLG